MCDLKWCLENNVWYCYAYFKDATYRIHDNPALSEGFPSTDVSVNAEYIRTRWEKIEQHCGRKESNDERM